MSLSSIYLKIIICEKKYQKKTFNYYVDMQTKNELQV